MSARLHAYDRPGTGLRAGAVAAALALSAAPLRAQADLPQRAAPLAARVAAVREGTVHLAFALRSGVCGNGDMVFRTGGSSTRDREWERDCEPGPGRLALDVHDGRVSAVRFYVGGRWRASAQPATDLGTVPAAQAAGLLLGLVERADQPVARDAVMPATVADSAVVWPVLLRVAKDSTRPREARRQAVFWLGTAAAESSTRGLTELADDGDRDVRLQAVFALSRRPADESVPELLRIARTHRDPEMRRQAAFWLGRTNDPRALAWFETVLTKSP